jgi:LrgB-like family
MILARLPFASAVARGALFGVGANGAGTARAHQIGETEGAVAGRSRARGSLRSPIAIVGRPIHKPNTFLSKDSNFRYGTSATWQGTRTKAAFSPGADILALVRVEPVYGFTA